MEKAEEKLELINRYFGDFTTTQVSQFAALGSLYHEWNAKINVISRKDEEHLYEKHVLHSLAIAAAFQLTDGMKVLDLGTGGGFPGIPLAIFFPSVQFILADSIGKKIKVVQAVAESIGLTNVSARHTRAEEIREQKFDVVVSRAVAPLGQLWAWSRPLLRASKKNSPSPQPDGLPVPHGLICLKGGDLAGEIAESGCRPRKMEITSLFALESFRDKYLLYVPAK